jgi:NitT/TauT family transport system permease protein
MSELAPTLGRAGKRSSGSQRQSRRGLRIPRRLQTLLAFALFLLVWEGAVRLLGIREYLLPAPSAVLAAFPKYQRLLVPAAVYTLQSVLMGYLAAVVVGVLIALPIALSAPMQRTVYPLLVFSQLVPKVALAPIFVVWFGFTLLPKILITFLLSFFPVVINTVVGLRSLDPEIAHLTRSTGANMLDTFMKVRLPAALPTMFAGFRLAAISATVGAVIGEFIGSDRGLGYVILTANGDLNTALSFAAIVVLTVIGLILYFGVERLERLCIPWHVSQRTGPESAQAV